MDKDQKIKQKLDELITGQPPPQDELLFPALDLLRSQNARRQTAPARKKRFRWFYAMPAAALALALLIIIPVITLNTPNDPEYYLLSTDSAQGADSGTKIAEAEIVISSEYAPLFPSLTDQSGAAVTPEYTHYTVNNNCVAVKYEARRLTRYAIEDVVIYAELTGLVAEELAGYVSLDSYRYVGASYGYTAYAEGGECYAKFYIASQSVRYYTLVMSPGKINKDYYVEKLFENL